MAAKYDAELRTGVLPVPADPARIYITEISVPMSGDGGIQRGSPERESALATH